MANIIRFNGGNSTFPLGYKVKTGNLAMSSLDGNKYIPLSACIKFDYTNWNDSFSYTQLTDNNGKNYGRVGVGGANSEANPRIVSELTIDLLFSNNMDFNKLKSIRSFNGPQSMHISAWLEKVGGGNQ